jgi:hypothetical protein
LRLAVCQPEPLYNADRLGYPDIVFIEKPQFFSDPFIGAAENANTPPGSSYNVPVL